MLKTQEQESDIPRTLILFQSKLSTLAFFSGYLCPSYNHSVHMFLKMALREFLSLNRTLLSSPSYSASGFAAFSSKSNPYIVKVGIPEFLNGVGKGVEKHVEKLESELGDLQKLLVTRTLKLKKLGIPCKDRKLILKYAQKYRLGLWRPRAQPGKA